MSLQNPLRANEAMYSKEAGDYFYPQTVAKQVLMEDGNRLDAYLGGMVIPNGIELLWENPDPTAEFVNQDIIIDKLADYKFLVIIIGGASSYKYARTASEIIENGTRTHLKTTIYIDDSGMTSIIGIRNLFPRNTTISFGVGQKADDLNSTSWTIDNKVCIPQKIYGIKENATIGGEGTLLNANMLGGVAAEEYVKKSETGMDLLWENASPTSAFGGQTLSLDLSNYSCVLIIAGFDINYPGTRFSVVCTIGDTTSIVKPNAFRTVSVTSNSVVFGPSDDSNKDLIPQKIYGIK